MKAFRRLGFCLMLMALVGTAAFAVEPAYRGHLGNPEEPAMRPYKWLYRGVKALVYQTVTELKDGNQDFPIVGSVYAFRGLRRGLVEFNRSVWRGMCGANNRTVTYKDVGSVNRYIEEDVLLRNAADAATAIFAAGMLNGSARAIPEVFTAAVETVHVNGSAVEVGAAIFGMQKILDRSTPVPEWTPKEFIWCDSESKCALASSRETRGTSVAKGSENYMKTMR